MTLLPNRTTLASFLILILLPSVVLPILAALAALAKLLPIGLVLITIYIFPAFVIATAIGMGNLSVSGTYSSPFFEGYIGVGPTPLGVVFCSLVWFVIGYSIWVILIGRKQPSPHFHGGDFATKSPEDY